MGHHCKPGPTCLTHGSKTPDANTSVNNRSTSPTITGLDIAGESVDDHHESFMELDFEHTEFDSKPQVATFEITQGEPENKSKVITDACSHNYEKNKGDCNHFVKAVEKELGYSDFSVNDNADAIVGLMEKSSDFKRLKDAKEAKQMADEGKLVIAGLRGKDQAKPNAHGHVAIVVAGPLTNGAPTGYWGSLAGKPKANASLRWAWTAADIKNVEYFARK